MSNETPRALLVKLLLEAHDLIDEHINALPDNLRDGWNGDAFDLACRIESLDEWSPKP